MEELTAIKRELKCWESMFERKHGRRPNKDDIKNASDEIRDTYVKYKHLKEAMSNKKEEKEEEDDGVFGKKLNKRYKDKQPLAPAVRLKGWENIKPVRLCHGQRPKPKVKSPSDKTVDVEKDNETKSVESDKETEETLGLTSVNIANTNKTPRLSQTPNQITNSLRKTPGTAESRLKRRASLFAASLKKMDNHSEEDDSEGSTKSIDNRSSLESNRFKGNDVCSQSNVQKVENAMLMNSSQRNKDCESEKENNLSCPKEEERIPCSNERKMTANELKTTKTVNPVNQNELSCTQEEHEVLFNDKTQTKNLLITAKKHGETSSVHSGEYMPTIVDHNVTTEQCPSSESEVLSLGLTKSINKDKDLSNEGVIGTAKNVGAVKLNEAVKPTSKTSSKPYRDDNEGGNNILVDNSSNLENDKDDVQENKRKRKAAEDVMLVDSKRLRKDEADEYENMDTFDSFDDEEGGHSDKGPEETFEEVKVKSGQPKSRSSSSGLVSDNFVRLDMKHKTYRRRGHGMTGGAYKRRAYNNIMKARGEYVSKSSWSKRGGGGGGRGRGRGSWGSSKGVTGTCYKCGQEGHWAKNCTGKATMAREIPDDYDDDDKEEFAPEDDDFIEELTLEKAANMAAGVPIDDDGTDDGGNNLVVLPHQLPRPIYVPPPPPEAIEPLFETVGGKIKGTPKEVYAALGQLGFSTFRSGQEEAIMRILSGVSSLVVLSTGAGKSLCYQLPAYMYYKRFPCMSLVISPLVSLMEDQISSLPFGLKGACLHTNQTKAQREKIIENIVSGEIAVLLLSPEALVGSGSGGGCLPSSARLPSIAFACIDEAHCLSEWSHNFRPSYLRVCKVLRERFGVRCFLGLTATATRATAASVALHLGISDDEGAVIRGAAVPPNLYLSVSRDRDRDTALIELLQGPRFSQCESIIIYCTRREVTERVATMVRTCLQHMTPSVLPSIGDEDNDGPTNKKSKKKGKKKAAQRGPLTWEAESYHAGMSAAQRRRVQKRFMSGELRLVVATVAFGMGLDKSNVRVIIHYNMPKSFEGYVQEIGRAGRDGLPSHCHVFLDREGQDMYELKRHIHANTVDRVVVKKLVNRLFPRCQCKKLRQLQQKRERQNQLNRSLEHVEEMNDAETEELITDEMLSQITEEQMINGDHQKIDKMEQTINDADDEKITKMEQMINEGGTDKNEKMEQTINDADNCGQENVEMARVITNGSNHQEREQMEQMIIANDQTQEDTLTSNETHCSNNKEQSFRSTLEKENPHGEKKENEECVINKELDFTKGTLDKDGVCENDQSSSRICGGHEVAIAIDSAVEELDMPEQSIATLLCYLELHSNRWLEVLKPLKATCTVKFYGGHAHLKAVAKRIPPIAAAVVHCEKKGRKFKKESSLVFPVVEIADKMGWDLDPVYKELRALQWNSSLAPDSKMGSSGQSGILVEMSDNAMHVRAPGDLSDEDRDKVCDFLDDRIQAEERTQLKQIETLYSSLRKVSCSEYWQCSVEVDKESDQELKTFIKAYFEDKNNATQIELEALQKGRENDDACVTDTPHDENVNWDGISRDIRALTNIHHDQSFTGRAVARIFHGIMSPCYPAEVWGRDRRFWRKHLDVDFNSLRKHAIRELLKLR